MSKLYQSPLRVYLGLLCLALLGVWAGMNLPVSLFPNSSKPKINVSLSYGNLTPDEFLVTYGHAIEDRLRAASFDGNEVDMITSEYKSSGVDFIVEYRWGTPGVEAVKQIDSVMNGYVAQLPEEIKRSLGVWNYQSNNGFFAMMFYSDQRSIDELYEFLDPIFAPKLAKVIEAEWAGLWNPNAKEVRLILNPEKMALLQITPNDIQNAVYPALQARGGGSLKIGEQNMAIQMNRQIKSLDDLASIAIRTKSGWVNLSEVARVDFGLTSNQKIYKTSGATSLMLYASPRAGGNIKKMSEDILAIVREVSPELPKDIGQRNLVDPSEFIRQAINNVLHEVFLAAFLAVLVLYLFIGSLKNVITAAIEIPMSIVLAFIMMKWWGINLNLISLGGLALSAGMNVDASVVVMENIFRRFEEEGGTKLNAKQRLKLVVEAVNEVKLPVIASTIASLVVFVPLALTAGLTNAILGDLAMAVVFSHGFSAFVALVLVPTVRLQMLSFESTKREKGSPIEKHLRSLEAFYAKAIHVFINNPRIKYLTYSAVCASLALLIAFVLPRLPKEIVGRPDTDWIWWSISAQDNSEIRQMEEQVDQYEAQMLSKLGSNVAYTYTQIWDNNSSAVMIRLKDKKKMTEFKKTLEEAFPNTTENRFYVGQWNPSEMRIPDPPAMTAAVRAKDAKLRTRVADEVKDFLKEQKFFKDTWTNTRSDLADAIALKPAAQQWQAMRTRGFSIDANDVADIARIATQGRHIGNMTVNNRSTDIYMKFAEKRVNSIEDLGSLPIGVDGKIVPLSALTKVSIERAEPEVYREDGRSLVRIEGNLEDEKKNQADKILESAKAATKKFLEEKNFGNDVTVEFEDSAKELNFALNQLGWAIALSILLIFLTMVFQFGDVVSALLVLVSVPLGFIGVLASLFIFKSTLSLNSALGVILLNGLSVANSIILVDFLRKLVDQGIPPAIAAQQAAKKRLRPILMTSLTTGLGMTPIALGMGDGGKILQPLGIAVIGGLAFSMITTLFIVPSLQVAYLEWRQFKKVMDEDEVVAAEPAGIIPPQTVPNRSAELDA